MVGTLVLDAHGDSARGGRPANEDAFTLLDSRHPIVRSRRRGSLFAVADGLGGHAGGAVASSLAVETLARFFDTVREHDARGPLAILRDVALEAHRCIRERAAEDPSLEGMGTTLTAAHVDHSRLRFVHAGDSCLFQLRDGRLSLLTEDQTVAAQLRRVGRLSEREYRTSPFRHSLFSYLGGDDLVLASGELSIRAGDRYLLATDGLLKCRREASVASTGKVVRNSREWVEALLASAARSDASDNTTCVAIFVGESSNGRL
jgi:PPM family protein phosphatase